MTLSCSTSSSGSSWRRSSSPRVDLLAGRVRSALLWPVIAALAVAPTIGIQAAYGIADVPLAVLVALCFVCAWRWTFEGDRFALGLLAVLGAGAVSTKSEGLFYVGALFLVVLVLLRRSRARVLPTLAAGGVAALGVVPWRLYARAHGLHDWFGINRGNPLVDRRVQRIPEAAVYLAKEILDPTMWLLVSLFGLAAAALAWHAGRRREVAFALTPLALALLVLDWVYWNTPIDFRFQLQTSARRVVVSLVLSLALLAPLLLETVLRAGPDDRGRSVPPDAPSLGQREAARRPARMRVLIAAHRLPLAILAGTFVISRVLVHELGMRFDASPLTTFLQFADPELLHHRLLQTLWYLHIQPPLYNLWLGLVLKAFPHHFALAAHATYIALGAAATLGNYVLCLGLGLGRRLATGLSALLTVAPFTLVYENFLYYEYPVMVLMVLIGIAALRYGKTWCFRDGSIFFGLLAVAIYTRQVFQLPWMILLIALLAVASRRPKSVLKARRPGRSRVFAVREELRPLRCAEHIVVVRNEHGSDNSGRDAATRASATGSRRQALEARSHSAVVVTTPAYRGLVKPSKPTGVPILDEPIKSTGGNNLNAKPFIEISREYAVQSVRLVENDPKQYARGVAKASGLLSVPATNFEPVYRERDKIRAWDRLFNLVIYLRLPGLKGIGWFIPLMYLGVAWFGTRFSIRVLRAGTAAPRDAALIVFIATVVYFLLVAGLFDYGENQRVHLIIDDIVLILVATGLAARYGHGRSSRRAQRLS